MRVYISAQPEGRTAVSHLITKSGHSVVKRRASAELHVAITPCVPADWIALGQSHGERKFILVLDKLEEVNPHEFYPTIDGYCENEIDLLADLQRITIGQLGDRFQQ